MNTALNHSFNSLHRTNSIVEYYTLVLNASRGPYDESIIHVTFTTSILIDTYLLMYLLTYLLLLPVVVSVSYDYNLGFRKPKPKTFVIYELFVVDTTELNFLHERYTGLRFSSVSPDFYLVSRYDLL